MKNVRENIWYDVGGSLHLWLDARENVAVNVRVNVRVNVMGAVKERAWANVAANTEAAVQEKIGGYV